MVKSKIIVCAHKEDYMAQNDVYMPLQVGKALSKIDLGVQGDDEGENISLKNPNYCELTGLYWAWKNLKDVDYIGLAHYRRYFNFKKTSYSTYSVEDFKKSGILEMDPVDSLKGYDIILPKPFHYDHSNAEGYIYAHVIEDFYIMNRVILKHYPEYEQTIKDYFYRDNRWIAFNMFFTSKSLFDKYCEWLFPLVEEIESHVRLSEYGYQKRAYGFMGEMLLPLFCIHNKLKIKFIPICMVGDKTSRNETLRMTYLNCRNILKFWYFRPPYKKIDCYGKRNHIEPYFKMDHINI